MSAATELRVSSVAAFWGEVFVVESERGVLRVDLRPVSGWQAEVERALGGEARVARAGRTAASRQIDEYLAGKRRQFEVEIDWRLVSGFRRRVLRALERVPFGELSTYGELARRVGRPGGAQAVGGAMRNNPLPILVPCHRVVAKDGTLGGFSAGLDVKRVLLRLEGHPERPGGWVSAPRPRP